MHLNIQQVDFIETDIKKRGLSKKKLRSEILDHICCAVEQRMASGMLFHKAYLDTLDDFGENGLLALQAADKKVLQKQAFIKRAGMITTCTAACLFLFITSIGNAQDAPDLHPLKGDVPVGSTYGMKKHPIYKVKKLHKGIDFKVPMGTPVYATADGVVKTAAREALGYGIHLILTHDQTYQTVYGHLSEFIVKEGQAVQKGQLIGYSGNSGVSTAPHLHYEVRKNGESVNPEHYLTWEKQ